MFTRLREDIATIRERDPAARSAWEVLTCYPGLHALVFHRLAHACWQARRRWLARFVSQIARFMTGIEIHPGATVGRRVFIDHGMGVVIGETAQIGDDCTIYQGVTLGGTSLTRGAKRHPTLERGVIVGAGAKVLGGFTIGADAKIGSNAVVTKPVPAGGTAVGNPARVIVPAAASTAAAAAAASVVARAAAHAGATGLIMRLCMRLPMRLSTAARMRLPMLQRMNPLPLTTQRVRAASSLSSVAASAHTGSRRMPTIPCRSPFMGSSIMRPRKRNASTKS